MAVGDVYRLQIVTRRITDGPAAVNNLYFKQADALVFDTPEEDLVGAFLEESLALYVALYTNTLSTTELKVAKAPLFLTSYILGGGVGDGQLTGDPMPARIAGVLSYRSADLTRRGRGRIYLPPAAESVNTAGAPSTGYVDALNALGQSFIVGMAETTITHSGWIPQMWSPADQLAKEVLAYEARGRWGTQRDRSKLY